MTHEILDETPYWIPHLTLIITHPTDSYLYSLVVTGNHLYSLVVTIVTLLIFTDSYLYSLVVTDSYSTYIHW